MKRRSYQQGSVVAVKKNGKIVGWDFRRREDGQNKSVRLGTVADFPLKAMAEKAAEPYRVNINENRDVYRFRDLAIRWEQNEKPDRMSTRDGYLTNLRRLRARWDDVRLDEMAKNVYQVETWLNDLKTLPGYGPVRPVTKKYKNNIKWFLHGMFGRAVAWGMVPVAANPIMFLKVEGKDTGGSKTDMVEPADLQRLLEDERCTLVCRMMMAVVACTSLRISEGLGLRWSDVDLDNMCLDVQRSSVGRHIDDTKTKASNELVPMHPRLGQYLELWRDSVPPVNGWLFGNPVTGRPYWAEWRLEYLREAGKRIGLRLGWHSFRHSYRRMMEDQETPIERQLQLMRHSSTGQTRDYGKRRGATLELNRPFNTRLVESLNLPEPTRRVRPAGIAKSSTGLFGVSEQKVGGATKYVAKLSHNGRKIYLGLHDTKEAAARVYDKEAYRLKGVNASLNFPEDYAVTNN